MFPNPIDVFQNEPLLRLTKVMSLNAVLRRLVHVYFQTRTIDPDAYVQIGLSKAEILAELEREIQTVQDALEGLDPLTPIVG